MTSPSKHTAAAILFNDSAIPTNNDLGFTPFFEKNLTKFRAPLPLTIFNEGWQDKAILHWTEKRGKADDVKKNWYTGYPYPNKYLQTYQEWSVNHQGFLAAVNRIPSHANLATWLIAHKRNANGIIRREGFMMALRYDIHVRTNALTHRVKLPDGRLSVANISVFQPEIVLTVHAKVVKFGEAEYTDNPYAVGCARAGWDPTTGQPFIKKDDTSGKTPLHLQQPLSKSTAAKPGPEIPKGPSNTKDSQAKQSGYKGSRWNPAYGDRDGGGRNGGGGGGSGAYTKGRNQ
ncbi:hypothetical protein PTTG_01850 [Puccinia triticina 1-1 BBBD Race 1]|uniref:Uncharacterized protein n=1 Tax=Puccinia triticina (isolate 1-1 / race 1 (BBBD)) TaxID=630390 RepID=A0A0C4EM61_PUCT1|nr:hypothetical protein PTTG_01850 [Puccinia triticina 1-1 BBBD Race 1]